MASTATAGRPLIRAATAAGRGRQLAEVERPAGNRHRGRTVACGCWSREGSGRDPRLGQTRRRRYRGAMPTFDIVSQVDMQEVRNAVDQAQRELATRFDFKGTESTDRAARHGAAPALVHRGPLACRRAGARGEARQAQGVPEGARLRQGRGGGQGHRPPDGHAEGRPVVGQHQGHQPLDQGSRGPRGSPPRPRATRCGSRARSETTCRPSSPACGKRTSGSPCSSRTSGTDRDPPRGRPSGPTPSSAAGRCGPRSAGGRRTGS